MPRQPNFVQSFTYRDLLEGKPMHDEQVIMTGRIFSLLRSIAPRLMVWYAPSVANHGYHRDRAWLFFWALKI